MHHLEAWNEGVCGGAWGGPAAKLGEKIRQELDLEHWAAFNESFERLAEIQRSVGAGERGEAPASIVTLSGDVHHAYLSRRGLPARRRRAQRGLPGRVLAAAQPAGRQGAPRHQLHVTRPARR